MNYSLLYCLSNTIWVKIKSEKKTFHLHEHPFLEHHKKALLLSLFHCYEFNLRVQQKQRFLSHFLYIFSVSQFSHR